MHVVNLTGLSPETVYYFRVKSADLNGNLAISEEKSVTTTRVQTSVVVVSRGVDQTTYDALQVGYNNLQKLYDDLKIKYENIQKEFAEFRAKTIIDQEPPEITDVEVKDVKAFESTICWRTNEPTIGFIEYGTKPDEFTFRAGTLVEYKTNHCVVLQPLKMGTKYYFQIIALDKSGNKSIKK
jgi:hypothetical protein